MNLTELKIRVSRAIENYNKYRSPEATARLLSLEEDRLEVELSGTSCTTCGFYDWIDDLRWDIMDEVNKEVEIENIDGSADRGTYKVRMRIKK